MNDEKRATDRVATNLPTRWQGVSGAHEGRIEDLSPTGCFVNTTSTVDVGEMVSLLIRLPSDEWLPLRGKVVFFHQMTGFSVAFAINDEETRERLHELISAQDHSR
jgi:hypothetical protein